MADGRLREASTSCIITVQYPNLAVGISFRDFLFSRSLSPISSSDIPVLMFWSAAFS